MKYVLVIDGQGKLSFSFYHERDLAMVKRFRDFMVRNLVPQGFIVTLCDAETGVEI